MSTTTKTKASEMSIEELELALKEKKAAEQKALNEKRAQYEDRREELINSMSAFAVDIEKAMVDLKLEAFRELTKFRQEMLEYGDLRRGDNNKGSFEIKNENYKIVFSSQINKRFDERAELAESKLKAFIESFVKKKDKATYMLVKTLLERNAKTGDYDINNINRLYAIEDQFDDPNWKDAIRLFKESYNPTSTAQYIRFFVKNTTNNSWTPVVLDMAKLNTKTNDGEPETTEA